MTPNGGSKVESPSKQDNADSLIDRSLAFIHNTTKGDLDNSASQEMKDTPLLTWAAKAAIEEMTSGFCFNQVSLLGHKIVPLMGKERENFSEETNGDEPISTAGAGHASIDRLPSTANHEVNPIFLNTDAPWSAFICGSQGSGKSHTLSCILENCLYKDSQIGKLPAPLGGIVFHYNSQGQGEVCEVAYLASLGVKVRVLVSETNYKTLQAAYAAIPKASENLEVHELLLRPEDLNAGRLRELMAFGENDGTPLYKAVRLPPRSC